jgi:hypothetical protein
MTRDTHILMHQHGQDYPTVVGFLAAYYEERTTDERHGAIEYRITQAALATYRCERGKVTRRQVTSGVATDTLSALWRLARPGSSVWVWASGLYRLLTGLGFFAQIDNKTWELNPPAPDAMDGATGTRPLRWRGFCC